MNIAPLHELLEPAAAAPRICAEQCAAALREARVVGAGLLGPLGQGAREDLAPTWAAIALADGFGGQEARDRGRGQLARLAAELARVRGGGDAPTSVLGIALALGLARGQGTLDDLIAAVEARRTEFEVTAFSTRRELADHLRCRGKVLPELLLRHFGHDTERRRLLLGHAALASELARGLASQGHGLERGRLLLSGEDLVRHGVPPAELAVRPTPKALRRAFSEQVHWAREHLALAWALTQDLGWRNGAAAVAGAWLRGTEERLRAVERAHFDLNQIDASPPRPVIYAAWLAGALWWLPPRTVSSTR